MWLALESTRQHEVIGTVERITPEGISLPFEFPKDKRGWPFYIEESATGGSKETLVEVLIKNTGPDVFSLTVREIASESTQTFSLRPGEERSILNSRVIDFVRESKKGSRLKRVSEGFHKEWPPLFYIRSTGGELVRGTLRIISDVEISLQPPIHFFSELPPDTL